MKYTGDVKLDMSFYFNPIVEASDEDDAFEQLMASITIDDIRNQVADAYRAQVDDASFDIDYIEALEETT